MARIDEELWRGRREVLARLEESGLSAAEFCRREGIAYTQLMTWKRRIRELDGLDTQGASREEHSPAFAELVLEKESPGAQEPRPPQVEIALPSGVSVRVYKGADAATLALALREARSC